MLYVVKKIRLPYFNKYHVFDERDEQRYEFYPSRMGFAGSHYLEDMSHQILMTVLPDTLRLRTTYELYLGYRNDLVPPHATIVRYGWFRPCYKVDVPGGERFRIMGNLLGRELAFGTENAVVAAAIRAIGSWSTFLKVELNDPQHEILVLTSLIAVLTMGDR